MSSPLASICCITYNHEKFIKQTLESFLMQKTNFDFEIVIGEDCSTDKTKDIILEYYKQFPNIINCFVGTTNIGMHANMACTIKACRGKYIAMCEGDDYWTDPNKLQKQVDFLEANPDYVLIHTDSDALFVKTDTMIKNYRSKSIPNVWDGDVFKKLLRCNFVFTLTAMFKSESYHHIDYIDDFKQFEMGDYPLWLALSRLGKFKYLPESTAVYRINNESASHFKDIDKQHKFNKSVYDIQIYFMKHFLLYPALLFRQKLAKSKFIFKHLLKNYLIKVNNKQCHKFTKFIK